MQGSRSAYSINPNAVPIVNAREERERRMQYEYEVLYASRSAYRDCLQREQYAHHKTRSLWRRDKEDMDRRLEEEQRQVNFLRRELENTQKRLRDMEELLAASQYPTGQVPRRLKRVIYVNMQEECNE